MLPTSSGRAIHLENTNTFVALCETLKAYVENEPQRLRLAKRKCLRMGLERRPLSAFGFYCRRGSPPYAKNRLVHCIRPESGVRYQSPEKSRELCCGRRYWP